MSTCLKWTVIALAIWLSLGALASAQRAGSSSARGRIDQPQPTVMWEGGSVPGVTWDSETTNSVETTYDGTVDTTLREGKKNGTAGLRSMRRPPLVQRIVPRGASGQPVEILPTAQTTHRPIRAAAMDAPVKTTPASVTTTFSAVGGSRMRRAPQEDLECVSTVLSDNGWTRPEVAYDSGEQSGCSCGEGICLSGLHVGCSDCVARRRWSAGIEFTILKPHISNNVAFTTIESDGATFETRRETWFNYGSKLAPRVWIEMSRGSKLGLRFHYWQFNFGSDSVVGSPDASGLERVFHPVFADIDLAATVPDSEYRADSTLNAYVFDLEATRSVGCGNWIIVGSSGLRIADIEQTYTSQLINESGQQQGAIDFQHSTQGVGPTVSLRAQRPFLRRFSLFGLARGSLIFGEGVSQLTGVEDEGLDTEFTTRQRTERDDVLPIGELQVGLQWMPRNFGVWHPYVHLAMEGQVWQDVGNAANEVGDLGLFGANIALGFNW